MTSKEQAAVRREAEKQRRKDQEAAYEEFMQRQGRSSDDVIAHQQRMLIVAVLQKARLRPLTAAQIQTRIGQALTQVDIRNRLHEMESDGSAKSLLDEGLGEKHRVWRLT